MTREETSERRIVMQHFEDGGEVEHKVIGDDEWRITRNPSWDWSYFEYRIVKPKPVSIPLTEEERKELTFVSVKYKTTGRVTKDLSRYYLDEPEKYYFLNPSTQCWEEWSEELEKELLK